MNFFSSRTLMTGISADLLWLWCVFDNEKVGKKWLKGFNQIGKCSSTVIPWIVKLIPAGQIRLGRCHQCVTGEARHCRTEKH